MRIKHTALASIFKSAQDNWPEDEAAILTDYWQGCIEDGYTEAELAVVKAKDIAHMESVFSSEPDATELIARFHTEINRRMHPKLF